MNETGNRNGFALENARTWPASSASPAAVGTVQPSKPPSQLGLGWVLLGTVALASISCAVGALIHHLF